MSTDIVRWGGPPTIIGGLLLVVFAVAANFIGESHSGFHALNAPPNALLAAGVVGVYLYLRRRGNFGVLGKIGFYICVSIFAIEAMGGVGIILAETFFGAKGLVTVLDIIHPLEMLLVPGLILFGVGILRSGNLTRLGATLIIAVPVLLVVGMVALGGPDWVFVGSFVLLGLALAVLGYEQRQQSEKITPAVR